MKSDIREVRSFCLEHAANSSEADDITQEVFLRAFRSLQTFHTDRSFGAWLQCIASNQVKTHYAQRARQRDREAPFEYERADSSLCGPAEGLVEQSDQEAIRTAVENLKPTVKDVVSRYYFTGQSVDEISEALNISRYKSGKRKITPAPGTKRAAKNHCRRCNRNITTMVAGNEG